jgi:hypothetical protein
MIQVVGLQLVEGNYIQQKVVVQLGFASEARSCICWFVGAPCGHNVTCGGIGTWLSGHVACIVGNDYVYTLTIVATFVGQGTCGYLGGLCGNAPNATLGSQPWFISQLGYGGQLLGIG